MKRNGFIYLVFIKTENFKNIKELGKLKNKNKIVFLSSKNRYLEHDLYLLLARAFPDNFESIYLESDYLPGITYNSSSHIDHSQKIEAFDDYMKIPPISLDKRNLLNINSKLSRVISNYKKIFKWKKDFISTIDKINPNAIVLISPNEFNAKLIQAFRNKITKLYIQPANIQKTVKTEKGILYLMKRFIFHKVMKLPFFSNNLSILKEDSDFFFLLWSKIWVSHIKKDLNEKYLFVGAPKYDKYFQSFQNTKLIPAKPNVVIYLNKEMHVGIENWNIYADFYKKIINSFPANDFVIKAHPLGSTDLLIKTFPTNNVTKGHFPIEQADLVLTHWSTMCLESISKGIPTILINPDSKFDFSEFHLQNYPAIATNIEEFTQLFANFRDSSNSKFPEYRKDFIRELLYSDDGKSTARAVNAIDKILSGTLI